MSFSPPNYTQVPNDLLDQMLPFLCEGELKVLLVIIRKTMGYHKIRDKISLSQLEKFTGLTRTNILSAIKKLISKGVISKEVLGIEGRQETYYELVVVENSNNLDQSLSGTGGGPEEGRGGVLKKDPQKKESKESIKKGIDLVDVKSLPLKREKQKKGIGKDTKFPLRKDQQEFFDQMKALDLGTDDDTLMILVRTAFKENKVAKLRDAISHLREEIRKGTVFKKPKIALFRAVLNDKVSPISERAVKNKQKAEEIKDAYLWNTLEIHDKFVFCTKTNKEIPLDIDVKVFFTTLKELYILNKSY
jgi:phage replication O-like protein O